MARFLLPVLCDLQGEKRSIKNCGELFERFSPRLDTVTIHEDTRGFIRTNLNQQFVVWPCKYDPQAILIGVLDQALSYVQKQDRGRLPFESSRCSCTTCVVDESNPAVLAMFTKTLAIIDCISTLITIRPDYAGRFDGLLLRMMHLLPG